MLLVSNPVRGKSLFPWHSLLCLLSTGWFQEQIWKCVYKLIASYTIKLKSLLYKPNEPCHDKTNIMALWPAWFQISLRIRAFWSGSMLFAYQLLLQVEKLIANCMDPDQTARMRRLVWIHAGRKPIMLVCRDTAQILLMLIVLYTKLSVIVKLSMPSYRQLLKTFIFFSKPTQLLLDI
jgi:hypothetical protein